MRPPRTNTLPSAPTHPPAQMNPAQQCRRSVVDFRLLNLNLAMHRLFSFPLHFHEEFKIALLILLSENGLFYINECGVELLCCHFCPSKFSIEEYCDRKGFDLVKIRKEHNKFDCNIGAHGSKNIAIGERVILNNYFEAHRLFSILKKTDWKFVDPFDLAKSGFYYMGKNDEVWCVHCNVIVRGWEPGDTPDGEHRKWNERCRFLCSDSSVVNYPIGSEPLEGQHDGIGKKCTGANPFPALAQPDQPPAPVMENQGAQPPAAAPQGEAQAPQGEQHFQDDPQP
ncbi:Hypothetical predicted protein [Cloeon dipterum]|uniref:Uncharacterized protein n=1 Tax=Cloeon dipterum TaxID=197152 RepID=A0A8S1E0W9_9INSE|nr:Hypothetical predicted protein [Cloeon dipterum]